MELGGAGCIKRDLALFIHINFWNLEEDDLAELVIGWEDDGSGKRGEWNLLIRERFLSVESSKSEILLNAMIEEKFATGNFSREPETLKQKFIEIISAEILKSTVSKNEDSWWGYLSWIIPEKYQEEIKGDLLECKSKMKKNGLGKLRVNLVFTLKIFVILMATIKIRFYDFLSKVKEFERTQ